MAETLFRDTRGTIRLYDGTVVYVVQINYSSDGKTFWETEYNPFEHYYENDGVTLLQGHKYMRVKHAEDTKWQTPMYITATDGRSPEIRIEEDMIQWGYTDIPDSWKNIISTEELKGPQGDVGPQGSGLEIDRYCYYGVFKDSTPTGGSVSGCTSCNRGEVSTTDGKLYMSLGDGIHEITDADRTGGKFRSDDGVTWLAIGTNDVGKPTRFIADDVLGTNSLDYRLSDTEFNSRGKIYVYNSDIYQWSEVQGLSAGNPLVAPSLAKLTEGKFLTDYSSTTIGLDPEDNLEVKDESISVPQLKDGTFTHGLSEGISIKVAPDELEGKGIRSYISSTDSERHFQVFVEDFLEDGLTTVVKATVENESNIDIKVNAPDLVTPATGGLTTRTQLDGFDDFEVIPGDCIALDVNGVNVIADELTLAADNLSAILVNPTDNNAKGIQAKHLHQNVANIAKGIQKGNGSAGDTLGALEVKLDLESLVFDGGTGAITINADGVRGIHLNDDVAGDGITIVADQLAVDLVPNGGLEFSAGKLQLSDADYLTDKVVKSLNGLYNDLTLTENNVGAGASGLALGVSSSGSTIEVALSADVNQMKTWLGISSGSYAPLVHTHPISDVIGLQAELDNKVTKSVTYGTGDSKVTIDPVHGLTLESPAGKKFKVIITGEAGNLDTVEIL